MFVSMPFTGARTTLQVLLTVLILHMIFLVCFFIYVAYTGGLYRGKGKI